MPPNIRRHPHDEQMRDQRMHDGNVCGDDEELNGGLCYTKCDRLTEGKFPFRFDAFTCCEVEDCKFNILKMSTASLIPCHGYDVSSEDDGMDCPHTEGLCGDQEEQYLDLCYEKCDRLTHGAYPHRVAVATCCKGEGLACLNVLKDYTNWQFDKGLDGIAAHLPSASETESR